MIRYFKTILASVAIAAALLVGIGEVAAAPTTVPGVFPTTGQNDASINHSVQPYVVLGVDSVSHLDCWIGAIPYNANCSLPVPPSASGATAPYNATPVPSSMVKGVSTVTAVGMTFAVGAKFCVVQAQGGNLNYEDDGGTPGTGATGGIQLNQGYFLSVTPNQGATIKFINQVPSSGATFSSTCYS